ncbi:MAG: class flavin-dependent oxidoreductase [Jatrophihabitantaceae bacterium]|nr:class flavin-dependent oxidoreductase [Jatrophihabitantaceae bacterium]
MKNRIGIALGPQDLSAAGFADAVNGIADNGFDSLWISEVLTSPGPDPLIALAAAAHIHPKLKLGTTMLLPGRNPVRLAKSLATLDVLSGGRLLVTFVPGLAAEPERSAIGAPMRERGRIIEETMPLLRRWWAGETVDGVQVLPRPVQDPLELWLGGLAPKSLERCGRIGEGWLTSACTPAEAAAGKAAIDKAADAAGREVDPEHFGVSIGYSHKPLDDRRLAALAARVKGRDVDPSTLVPVGFAAVRDQLEAFQAVGFSKFVLRPTGFDGSWREELAALSGAVGDLQS